MYNAANIHLWIFEKNNIFIITYIIFCTLNNCSEIIYFILVKNVRYVHVWLVCIYRFFVKNYLNFCDCSWINDRNILRKFSPFIVSAVLSWPFFACVTFINYPPFTGEQKDHRDTAESNTEFPTELENQRVARDIASYTRECSIFESIPRRPSASEWTKTVRHFGNLINIDVYIARAVFLHLLREFSNPPPLSFSFKSSLDNSIDIYGSDAETLQRPT